MLARSYGRRKRFEAKLIAQEVVSALAQAMGGTSGASQQAPAPSDAAMTRRDVPTSLPTTVKPKALLALMGASID